MSNQLDPVLNNFTIQRYLQTSADKGNLKLVFEDNIKQPYTTRGEVHIPRLNDKTTTKDIVKLFRFVNHEASHHRYHSDFQMVQDEAIDVIGSLLGFTWGIMEDIRVDHHDTKEWMGDSAMMSDFYDQEHPAMLKAMKEIASDADMPDKQKAALQSLIGLDYLSREWCPGANLNLESLVNVMTPMAKQFLERMAKLKVHDKINELEDSKVASMEAWELAQFVYEHVFDEDPEEEKKRCQEEKKKKGEETAKEEGDQEGEGGGGGELGSKDDDEEVWDISKATVKWQKITTENTDESYGGSGIHIDYSDYHAYDTFHPCSKDKMQIIDFEHDKTTNISRRSSNSYKTEAAVKTVSAMEGGRGLANKVRRLLQIRSRSQRIYGQKTGKIDSRNLHRVTMKNAPGYNQRVFHKTIAHDTLNTAVSLVVDFSGSMHGSKSHNAIKSAILLYQAISKSLNVPLEIVGFSDASDASIMLIFKSFNGRTTEEKLLSHMSEGLNYMSGNADGEAIVWCYDRLIQRREKKKVMVVLSDGSPCCGRYGDIYGYTQEVVRKIENDHIADIVGIGIEDRNVERIYKNSQVINNSDQLEEAILKLIESKML